MINEFFKNFIDTTVIEDEQCVLGDHYWKTTELAECKGCEFYLDVRSLNLTSAPWTACENIADFLFHVRRCQDVNTNHRVLVHPDGWIMNGWHRVVRAIMDGKDKIPALRITELPDSYPIEESGDDDKS